MDSTNQRAFAPCPRGLEPVLRQELADLGATNLHPTDGGVGFTGTLATVYRVNLESRIASRVLWELAHAAYKTEQDVYSLAAGIPWPDWFTPARTIKVKVSARQCPLKSLDFVTLRVKDAVCDLFMQRTKTRPSVDTEHPDIRIDVFLNPTHATVYLDTSGEPLFKRGFRRTRVDAPLRENLAAGLVKLSGWTGAGPFIDPLCGSGTIPLEAAMIARNIAPGLGRHFAFEQLHRFDADLWTRIQEDARARQRPVGSAHILASDRDRRAIEAAGRQFNSAGVSDDIDLRHQDIFDLVPPSEAGVMVMNPPYGVRLGTQADLDVFYPKLGAWLKTRCAGWRVYLFTGDLRAPKLIGLAPSKRTPLFNGAIECRLYEFVMVQGGARRKLSAPPQE